MSEKKIVVAQIGCGYWGPNLVRNFSALVNCRVKYVVDSSAERRAFVQRSFPGTIAIADVEKVYEDAEVDAVILATPAHTHFSLGKVALEKGKHIFVEKPLATKTSEVDELARLAKERRLIVMAGHTFVYNNAVRYVKQLIEKGDLGEIRYIYSQRLNLGRVRSDIDALWNFAPHDISIIQYWLDNPDPISITRSGMSYLQDGVDDVVFLNIVFPKKVIANVHVSWLDPQKTRKIVVVGSRKMVIYDDIADDKIAIFDKGIEPVAVLGQRMDFDRPLPQNFSYRSGDVLIPKIDWIEPLRVEAEHFLECVAFGLEPITGTVHARRVVQILEKAESLKPRK